MPTRKWTAIATPASCCPIKAYVLRDVFIKAKAFRMVPGITLEDWERQVIFRLLDRHSLDRYASMILSAFVVSLIWVISVIPSRATVV